MSKPSTEEVFAILRDAFVAEDDVVAVYVFGSFAHGRPRPDSDVDVAVLLGGRPSREMIFHRRLQVGTGLEERLRRPLDLIVLNAAPPLLAFEVIRTGKLIIERDQSARCLFHVRAMNRYWDARPFLDAQRARTMERIRQEGLGYGYQGHRDALTEARQLREKLAPTGDDSSG